MKKCCRRIPQLVGCSHEISDKFLTKRKIGDINGRSSLMYRQFHPVKCVDTVIPNVADFLAHRLEWFEAWHRLSLPYSEVAAKNVFFSLQTSCNFLNLHTKPLPRCACTFGLVKRVGGSYPHNWCTKFRQEVSVHSHKLIAFLNKVAHSL